MASSYDVVKSLASVTGTRMKQIHGTFCLSLLLACLIIVRLCDSWLINDPQFDSSSSSLRKKKAAVDSRLKGFFQKDGTHLQVLANATASSALHRGNLILPKSPAAAEQLINGRPNTNSKDENKSLDRAIEQVHALMDLYLEAPSNKDRTGASTTAVSPDMILHDGVGSTISSEIVLTAVQSLILGSLSPTDRHEQQQQENLRDSLDKIEAVVWRLKEANLTPSLQIMDSLWILYESDLHSMETSCSHHNNDHPDTNTSKSAERRALNLLSRWYEWTALGELPPPPRLAAVRVLEHAHPALHLPHVWSMYQRAHRGCLARENPLPRAFYESVLSFLSSEAEKQCRALRDMANLPSSPSHHPTAAELESALANAASAGLAQEVAWIIRQLQALEQDDDDDHNTNAKKYQRFFVESLLHSKDAGSLQYMEQYVLSQPNADLDSFKCLLQKLSQARIPGAGMRAEAVFRRMAVVEPDWECVSHVVTAYLNEYSVSLSHVMDADIFVRDCVASHRYSSSNTTIPVVELTKDLALFDRLLEAYAQFASRSDPFKAEKHADELFRYMMVQHREGRIPEEPEPAHLQHLLTIWNRFPATHKDKKCLEYWQLLNHLHRRQVLSKKPTIQQARLLLSTLARTNEKGVAPAAESVFWSFWNDTKATERSSASAGLYNHMAWCVVKCYCQSREGIEAAWCLLNKLERQELSLGIAFYTLVSRQLQLETRVCSRVEAHLQRLDAQPNRWHRIRRRLHELKDSHN